MRFALASLLLAGCITHLPLRTREHLTIPWAQDYDDAARRAAAEHKPLLVMMIAGQIDGAC